MSKDIIIQEGGVDKNLNSIKKILTDEQNGGSCNWVPEDEVQRGTKTITKNGTYKASDDDLYGYSKVIVKVKGGSGGGISNEPGSGVSGKDPSDGNDYAHEIDDNGEIVTTKLPTRIVMSSLPYDTSYADGENINFTGAEVTAYYEDGSSYGVVPFDELTFEPTVASGEDGNVYSKDGVHAIALMCDVYASGEYIGGYHYATPIAHYTNPERWSFLSRTQTPGIVYLTKYSVNDVMYVYGCIPDGAYAQTYTAQSEDGMSRGYGTGTSGATRSNKFSSSTRRDASGYSNIIDMIPESEVAPWTIGAFEDFEATQNTITVSWPRIKDEKVLTTSFNINVSPSSNSQSGSGSSSGSGNSSSGGEDSGGGGSHGF